MNEDGKDTVKYILNEHSGNLEQLKEVQTPSCIKCQGKMYATVQTQVSEIDMQMKYISSTATQCTLISKGNESTDQVETSDICTIMHEEQNENCLASEMNCDIMTCDIGDGQNTTESINIVAHKSRKSYERRKEQNVGKKSEEEVRNYDDDDVIVGEFNKEVYKKSCHSKLCDDELMKKLV